MTVEQMATSDVAVACYFWLASAAISKLPLPRADGKGFLGSPLYIAIHDMASVIAANLRQKGLRHVEQPTIVMPSPSAEVKQ